MVRTVCAERSSNVAACGGDAVCIIDCTSGAVVSKYRVPREELYALAWTLLRFRGQGGQRRPVLVVGSGSGKLHLLYPTGNCCYGVIDAHKQPVSTMCFHPSQESLLFTAAYDKTVTLWDIGIPDTELNFSHLKLMTLAVAGVPLKLTSVMACPERGLLAAGVGGCWAWDISLEDSKTYR
uniref:leucine-rich repeat and WD repeat-containing protein 1-like n=1 Tax=Myxine glutinosa TaxID=7769 RepID=UPI00358F7FCC